MAVRNPWQMKLIQNLQGKEAQTAGLQRRRALNAGNLEAGPAALNVMADVARNFQANRQQAELTKSMQLDAESREAVARRDKAFSQAMQMYRGGLPVPQELASEAGMPGLTKLQPKQNLRYERNRRTGKLMVFSGGQPVAEYDMGAIPFSSEVSRKNPYVSPYDKLQIDLVKMGIKKPTSDIDPRTGKAVTTYKIDNRKVAEYLQNPNIDPKIKQAIMFIGAGGSGQGEDMDADTVNNILQKLGGGAQADALGAGNGYEEVEW